MKNTKIIERVKKLMRLSDSDNENEVALALASAEKLMNKYNIEQEDLLEVVGVDITECIYHTGNFHTYRKILMSGVADLYGCQACVNYKREYSFVGMEHAIAMCMDTIDRLTVWIELRTSIIMANSHTTKKTDYKNGLALGVARKINEIVEERKKSNNEKALILIDSALQEYTRHYRNGKPNKIRTSTEFDRGADDGNRAPIFREMKK